MNELVTVANKPTGEILVVRFQSARDRERIEATAYRLGQFLAMSQEHDPDANFDQSSIARGALRVGVPSCPA